MRGIVALALVGVLSGMTLGACSDNERVAAPSTSATPAPSSSATTPASTPPTPTGSAPPKHDEPLLPELAKERSQDGAEAFVRHYVTVLNYSFQFNDPRPLRPISANSCAVCAELIKAVEAARRKGGLKVGAMWHPQDLSFIPTQPVSKPIALVTIRVGKGSYKSERDDPLQSIEPHTINQEYRLTRSAGHWLIDDVTTL